MHDVDAGHGLLIYLCVCVCVCVMCLHVGHHCCSICLVWAERERRVRFPTRSGRREVAWSELPLTWRAGAGAGAGGAQMVGAEDGVVGVFLRWRYKQQPARLSLKTPAQPFDTLPVFLATHKTQTTNHSHPLAPHSTPTSIRPLTQPTTHTQHRQYGQSRCGVPNKHLHPHPVTAC